MYTGQDAKGALRTLFGTENPKIVDLSYEEYSFVVGYINPIIEGDGEGIGDLFDVLSDRIDIFSIFDGEDGEKEKDHRVKKVLGLLARDIDISYGETAGEEETVLIFEREKDIGAFNRTYCQLYAPFAFAALDKFLSEEDRWAEPRRHLGGTGDNIIIAEDLVDCVGYSDQYSWCDRCGKVIGLYNRRHRYFVGECEMICVECVGENPEDYIDFFVNKIDGNRDYIDCALVDPLDHGWIPLNKEYLVHEHLRPDVERLDDHGIDFVIASAHSSFRAWYEIYVKEEKFDQACDIVEEK